MEYRLSPSDLTFLYDGCKHCFVMKVKHGITQPSIPLPSVFSRIAALQKDFYTDKRLEGIAPGLPNGVIRHGEKWVRSAPIQFPGKESTCYIAGRFDIVAELDDGSYAVLDFKTGSPSNDKTNMYARQLHSYAYCLENPADGALTLAPVTRLGLLYFIPEEIIRGEKGLQTLEGPMQWIAIERNDEAFLGFLGDVIDVLDGPIPEPDPEDCPWCKYRSRLLAQSSVGVASGQASSRIATPECPRCGSEMRLRNGKFGEFWSCTRYPDCKGTRNV